MEKLSDNPNACNRAGDEQRRSTSPEATSSDNTETKATNAQVDHSTHITFPSPTTVGQTRLSPNAPNQQTSHAPKQHQLLESGSTSAGTRQQRPRQRNLFFRLFNRHAKSAAAGTSSKRGKGRMETIEEAPSNKRISQSAESVKIGESLIRQHSGGLSRSQSGKHTVEYGPHLAEYGPHLPFSGSYSPFPASPTDEHPAISPSTSLSSQTSRLIFEPTKSQWDLSSSRGHHSDASTRLSRNGSTTTFDGVFSSSAGVCPAENFDESLYRYPINCNYVSYVPRSRLLEERHTMDKGDEKVSVPFS